MTSPALDRDDAVTTVNLVVLRGVASGPPGLRSLDSGRRLASLSIRVHALDPGATSVPVVVREPAAWVEAIDTGDPLVVVGTLRRRFFRTVAGPTGARVEVEATAIGRGSDRRRLQSARRRAEDALEDLT